MKNKSFLVSLIIFSFAQLSAEESVKVACSDLLKDMISADAVIAESGQENIDIIFQGSYFSKAELVNGEVDIALITEMLPADKLSTTLGDDYAVIPLGYQTFFLTVNRSNPLSEISVEDARDVFVSDSDLKFQNWDSLGLAGMEFTGNSIQLFSLDDSFITFSIFEAQVLARRPLRNGISFENDYANVLQRVSKDAAVLALLNRKPNDPRVKVLALSKAGSNFAFLPTSENLFYGDYPYGMGYYLVFRKDASDQIKNIARSFASKQILLNFRKNGILILNDKLQAQVLQQNQL